MSLVQNPFLTSLSSHPNLKLEGLNLGFGGSGMNFSATVGYEPTGLQTLLTSLGWEAPSGATGTQAGEISLTLGYAKSRNNPALKSYVITVDVLIEGPIPLGELFEADDFPSSLGISTLNQVQLRFELDKTTAQPVKGGAKSTNEDIHVGFNLSFTDDQKQYVVLGLYQKQIQPDSTLRVVGGTVYSTGDGLVSFGFGESSPITIGVNSPFFLRTKITATQAKAGTAPDTLTLLGATLTENTTATAGATPTFDAFLEQTQETLGGIRLLYSSKELDTAHLELVNEILPVINVLPIAPLTTTQGYGQPVVTYFPQGFTAHGGLQLGAHKLVQLYANLGKDQTGKTGFTFLGYIAQISLANHVSDMGSFFGVDNTTPSTLEGATLNNIEVSLATATKSYSFRAACDLDSNQLDLQLTIEVVRGNGHYKKLIQAGLLIDGLLFEVTDETLDNQQLWMASYSGEQSTPFDFGQLKKTATTGAIKLPDLPDISLNDALIARLTTKGTKPTKKYLFGANLGVGLNMTDLPIVGRSYGAGEKVQLDIQPVYANQAFSSQDLLPIQQTAPSTGFQLLQQLKKGFSFNVLLDLGGVQIPLSLAIAAAKSGIAATSSGALYGSNRLPHAYGSDITWISVQKNFGPVHLQKVGLKYEKGELTIELDGSLTAAGLTLSLIDLGIGSPLSPLKPTFSLDGIGLSYTKGAFSIGGTFLRTELTDPQGNTYTEYDGQALIETSVLGIAALGSYANYQGHPSLFLYAVLNQSLGGPPFFFVTGLAAGFGYNRNLISPGIGQVQHFPLVTDALSGTASSANMGNVSQALASLHDWIPPQVGEEFFALGIKFTSFKMINSFALLDVTFGNELEVDVLGISTLIVPTPVAGESIVSPLAEVQLALKATYVPSEGLIGVAAQLTTNSFILSRNCHLTGGFAFFSWLDGPHAGDFVVTLGGYDKHFTVPSYYPNVPRLGFSWRVNPNLTLSGGIYYALTPHALMAGGGFSAVYADGSLGGSFSIAAGFLIGWQPYHYYASASIEMAAYYAVSCCFIHHHFNVSLGASLDLWGPELSGYARLDICGFHPSVSFGSASSTAQPINWSTFQQKFLPAPPTANPANTYTDYVVDVKITQGLLNEIQVEGKKVSVVDPEGFDLETNSLIPALQGGLAQASQQGTTFAIGSMGITDRAPITSTHLVTITLDGTDCSSDFQATPVTKNMPAGMWGTKLSPGVNDASFIANALTGFTVQPAPSKASEYRVTAPRSELAFETTSEQVQYATDSTNYVVSSVKDPRTTLASGLAATSRADLLSGLGFASDVVQIKNDQTLSDAFVMSPQILTSTTAKS